MFSYESFFHKWIKPSHPLNSFFDGNSKLHFQSRMFQFHNNKVVHQVKSGPKFSCFLHNHRRLLFAVFVWPQTFKINSDKSFFPIT